MTKLKTAMMAAGILSMGAAPLFAVSPVFAATACGIGQSAGACLGAQNAGGGEWVPPTVDLQASPAGPASIRITGPAELDIPYYAVTFDETITWHQGPGLVQSWSAPVGAAADAFVIPTADTAGQAAVTLNVPGTTGETGDYLIAFPAMSTAGGVKISSGIAQMTFTGQGANTLPVTYSANRPMFSLSQNGPWVSTITVPAGVASWSNTPAHLVGLVIHTIPASEPLGASERWQNGSAGVYYEMLLPAATPIKKVTPMPKPTPVKKVTLTPKPTPKPQPVPVKSPTPTPAKKVTPTPKPTPVTVVTPKPAPKAKDVLNVTAPAHAQFHQTIPVAIRLTKDGHPLADKVIRMTVSGGSLTHATTHTNAEGIAHDSIIHAPSGKILITAQRASLTAGAVVLVTAPSIFPWWLLLLLVLAAGVLVVIVIRRRHAAAEQDEPTEE